MNLCLAVDTQLVAARKWNEICMWWYKYVWITSYNIYTAYLVVLVLSLWCPHICTKGCTSITHLVFCMFHDISWHFVWHFVWHFMVISCLHSGWKLWGSNHSYSFQHLQGDLSGEVHRARGSILGHQMAQETWGRMKTGFFLWPLRYQDPADSCREFSTLAVKYW